MSDGDAEQQPVEPGADHGAIQRAAARVYDEGGWPVTAIEDGTGFTLLVEGSAGAWSALAITDDEELRFVFYGLVPVTATPDRIPAMSELLHRVNHGLVTGTFELAHDTGEVRLRTGIDLATLPRTLVEDEELLRAVVLDLSAANVEVLDRYLSAVVAVTMGADPAAVVAEIESGNGDDPAR